jgi:hypothetical protein
MSDKPLLDRVLADIAAQGLSVTVVDSQVFSGGGGCYGGGGGGGYIWDVVPAPASETHRRLAQDLINERMKALADMVEISGIDDASRGVILDEGDSASQPATIPVRLDLADHLVDALLAIGDHAAAEELRAAVAERKEKPRR